MDLTHINEGMPAASVLTYEPETAGMAQLAHGFRQRDNIHTHTETLNTSIYRQRKSSVEGRKPGPFVSKSRNRASRFVSKKAAAAKRVS